MKNNFYQYQQKRTMLLLFWGVANTVAGAGGALLTHNRLWRQFWLQALVWGAIDGLIAVFGVRGSQKKLAKPQLEQQVLSKDIRTYHRLLFFNAYLDLGYILSGLAIRRWGTFNQETRKGIGAGFVVQGLFLFIYDSLLAREVKAKWVK